MKRLLLTIGFCAVSSGCTASHNFTRTLFVEPLQYCGYFDEHHTHSRHCRLAKEAWHRIRQKNPRKRFSKDYACGFREGYTDFLDAGGTGQPPPLPPRRYWKDSYATPPGRQAVQDWFAGFRHGAAMARASGARQFAMVPLSTPVAGINGMYVNRQTGPTPVTILTPPMPDPALVAPRSADGGFDTSQLPDSTRPFGLLPGALPTRNLPPSTLPPGTSPPGVEPVFPGDMLSEPAPAGVMFLEPVPPGTGMPNPLPVPDAPRPDGLLPEPSSGSSPRNNSGKTGPAPPQKLTPVASATAQPVQATAPVGMTGRLVNSLGILNNQPDSPSGTTPRRVSTAGEAVPPYASSRRRASGDTP